MVAVVEDNVDALLAEVRCGWQRVLPTPPSLSTRGCSSPTLIAIRNIGAPTKLNQQVSVVGTMHCCACSGRCPEAYIGRGAGRSLEVVLEEV